MMTPKLRKMLLHLAEATLARYERVAERGRAHPPDFNALMMRICANIVEERKTAAGSDPFTPEERQRVDALRALGTRAGLDEMVEIMSATRDDPPFSDAPIRRSRRGQR